MQVHKFYLNGLYIVLDINSGAVHLVDNLAYDILDIYDGSNADEAVAALQHRYDRAAISEAVNELQELMKAGQLFAPELTVPLTFSDKPLVKSLCLHVAHDCNLRCGYCFAGTGDFGHTRGLMSKEIGEKAVDFIIANSGRRRNCELDFFGGEPLLNMDTVRHVVSYVRQRETETGKVFKLTLTTNALLLSDQIIEYLNANHISLVLSLDGRAETHDRMRPCINGSGSYDKVVKRCKQVADSRGDQNYYLRGTFTAYNPDFAADVLSMADLGFSQLSVEPVVAKEADYELTAAHLPELYRQYELLAEEYLARRLAGKGFDFFHFNLDLSNGPCVAKRLSGCGAGHEYFAVTPEGDLYPCHQFVGRDEYRLGNIDEGVSNTELPVKFRQAHVLNKPACRECWARFYCSGGCHANADLFHNDLLKPYELGCELQKKRLECAIMIQAKLAVAYQGSAD
ncbi:thioether cross-link-forming SCIFF peptide maturase [Sporomusa sp.]|uniref:thioether cross-link-forming SCIFF peptide maturase n=1 Tax=Sporomusa sp. TaxID=2078658 RepID=UPI002CEFDDE1|nr:thioether cross-link-forming SCIFF peptide maturase [Sporomusa sp.]HWR06926.1 thioether cross-link-forming SCIFF peptide maturase [Sporomusa sp.]